MHKSLKYFTPFLLSVALVYILPLTQVFAQDGISVKLQPSMVEHQVDPGAIIDGEFTITNENGGTQTYYFGTRNIDGMSEKGAPMFEKTRSSDSTRIAAWVEPLVESLTLEVNQSGSVPYKIVVPPDADPGSHVGAIFVSREADTATESGVGVGFSVASLIHVRVNGDVINELKLLSFATDKLLYTVPDVHFMSRIENTGTLYQRPVGLITITDMFGKDIATIPINEGTGGLIPGSIREFEDFWKLEKFGIGKYTATISIVFGEGKRETKNMETSFWVLPIREVGMVFGGIIGLLLLLIFVVRAYIARELRSAGHTRTASAKEDTHLTFARRLSRTITKLIVLLIVAFVAMVVFFQ